MKIILLVALALVILTSVAVWGSQGLVPPLQTGTEDDQSDEVIKDTSSQTVTGSDSAVRLSLAGKGLESVPMDVFTRVELVELDLSNNQLTGALQAEVRLLQNLKVLDLSDNKFTGVPAEIGQLQSLEVLNLSNNELTGLPNELGNLTNLRQLNLSGNAYSEVDLASIKKNLPASTIIIVD